MQRCVSVIVAFSLGLLLGSFTGMSPRSATSNVSKTPHSATSPSEPQTVRAPTSRKAILSKGDEYVIFEIHDDFDVNVFVGPTKSVISRLEERFMWLDQITNNIDNKISSNERGRMAYLEMMKSMVSGVVFLESELAVGLDSKPAHMDLNNRKQGLDWAYLGDTMTGWIRLDNVRTLLTDIVMRNVTGDYIETGV
jgi:hypothetical protein